MSLKDANTFIIGISGGSGSGKTSFIRDIKAHFSPEEICFLSQDDYYRPREQQREDENGIKNFDLPESINMDEYFLDLIKLTNGIAVEREEYTFNNNLKELKTIQLKPAPVIVVEGLFVFNEPRLFEMTDLRIIIHATD
ncbi:MAG TPA: uridine kinase, partial [Saprospiraceae bacterium]|nr:uridine kinase [Saprospiraceae bacterium]